MRFGKFSARERLLQRFIPVFGLHFPAERYAHAAIFIAWLQHQLFTVFADIVQQLNGLAVVIAPDIFHNARPWHMFVNDLAFFRGKQRCVFLIRQHGEERFHVRDLAAEIVGDANRT